MSRALKKKDFGVWCDREILGYECWFTTMENKIREIAKKGFVIILLTKNNINSVCVDLEAKCAIENKAKLFILIFDNVLDFKTAHERYRTIHIYYIPNKPKEEHTYLIVRLIENVLLHSIDETIEKQSEVHNANATLQNMMNYKNYYHPQQPVFIGKTGSNEGYCEVYQFPCCGKYVITGDIVPSVNRADGCCRKNIDAH